MCEVEAMFTKLHECMVNLLTQRGQHSYLMPTISIFSSTYYTLKWLWQIMTATLRTFVSTTASDSHGESPIKQFFLSVYIYQRNQIYNLHETFRIWHVKFWWNLIIWLCFTLSLISAAVFALISHVDRKALYCVTEYLSETQSTFFCTLSGMKSTDEGLFK